MTSLQKIFPLSYAVYQKPVFDTPTKVQPKSVSVETKVPKFKALFSRQVTTQTSEETQVVRGKFHPINFLMKSMFPIIVLVDLIYFIYKGMIELLFGKKENPSTASSASVPAKAPKPTVGSTAPLSTAKKV